MKKSAAPEVWGKMFQVTNIIRELYDRNSGERPPQQTTLAQFKVMNCILFSPGGCSVKELAERLAITPGAVSQIVEKLVREGTMMRVPVENDRRSVRITLSEAGLERHKRIGAAFEALTEKLLEGVPREKTAVFIEVLDHLIEAKNRA